MTVALARALEPEEFGQLVFALAAAQILYIMLDPRLEDSLIRFVPQIARDGGRGAATALYERFIGIDAAIALGAGGLAVAVLLSDLVPLGGVADPGILALAVVQMTAQAPWGTVGAAYGITDGWARFGLVDIVRTAVTTCAGLIGLYAGGAAGYLAASAATTAIATVVVGLVAWKRMRAAHGPASSLDALAGKGVGGYTVKSSIASSLSVGTEQLPLVVIGFVAGPQVLALFRVALAPARLFTAMFSPAAGILFPLFSRDAARGSLERIRSAARTWSLLSAAPALLGAVLAWLTLPSLLPLAFGDAFDATVTAASLLACSALVRGTVMWSKVLALAIGRPGVRIAVLAVETGLLALASWVLAHRGLNAIATAHLAIAILVSFIWGVLLRPLTEGHGTVSGRTPDAPVPEPTVRTETGG